MYQPGMVANPARGQLNGENMIFPVPVRARKFGLARRVRPSCPASARSFSPVRVNHQSSIFNLVLSAAASTYTVNRHWVGPEFMSGNAIAYRRRSLPKVGRHRASGPQGSFSSKCCLLRCHHGPIFLRLSFPAPNIGIY